MISDRVRVSRFVLLEHRLWNSTDRRRLSGKAAVADGQ
jgi:hypothetical protein